MSEWKEVKLEEVVEKFIDYRGKTPQKTTSGIPLITAKIVKNGTLLEANEFVTKETYDNFMTRGFPKINDVLLTTEAPLGEVALLKDDSVALAQRIILMRGKKELLDNAYLKYFLQSEEGQYRLDSRASGTTVFGIKASVLKELPIVVPPLKEQKAIAEVLSSLDDKIDLLHHQNKTLEALAQTFFRQWFVEEVGDDWEEVSIGDFVKTNVSTLKKDTTLKIIQYLDTSSLTEGKIDSLQNLELSDAPSRAKRIVKHNDVLISTVRPNQKHYGIIKNPTEDLIVSTGFCVISCETINPHFIYILLTTKDMTEYLHSIAEGSTSTYPSLKPSDIEAIEFQLPPEEKLQEFSDYADDAWDKIDNNHMQIKTLENMRDTLLPKLMSGDVRVEDG